MRKPRPNHVVGFVWPDRTRTSRKPLGSGGTSVCQHCQTPKVRSKDTHPRTRRDGCRVNPGGEHVWATDAVTKGWSNG